MAGGESEREGRSMGMNQTSFLTHLGSKWVEKKGNQPY